MHSARPRAPVPVVAPTTTSGGRAAASPRDREGVLPALPGVPRWLIVTALLVALPLTVLPVAAQGRLDTWWPANALVAALLLVLPRRHRWAGAVAATAALGIAVGSAYDLDLLLGLVLALTVSGPAAVTVLLLDRPGDAPGATPRRLGGARYHLVLIAVSLLTGVVALTIVAPRDGVQAGLETLLVGFTGSLAALVVVLPTFFPLAGRPRTGGTLEMWVQRLLLVLTVPASAVVGAGLVMAFPALCWAGLRATRREAHLQLLVVAVLVYVYATVGGGPLSPFTQGTSLPAGLAALPLYLFLAALAYLVVPLSRAVERLSQSELDAQRNAMTLERAIGVAHTTIFIVTGPDGRITHFNDGAVAATGYPASEALGRTGAFLVPDDEVKRKAEELDVEPDFEAVRLRLLERETRTDWEWQRRDGSPCTVSLSLSRIIDPDGSVVGCLACGDDVTERMRTQRALEAALDREHQSVLRLQEVDHVKQELVSNVSHELRTPITSIAGYAELLADASLGELTRPQRDALQRIERNALRLQSLVDDLLTLSRAEAGRLQLARHPVDLCQVTRSSWELFDEQLRHRALETQLTLPAQPVMVVGDRDALERVVVNLVSNAVKFTPDGGSVHVAVTRGSDGSGLLVVRDSGIGIGTDEQEKLFTRFFRSTQATDAAIQGTGLGLSIVQALVSQHGGQVAIRSRPGEGTRVTVELPSA